MKNILRMKREELEKLRPEDIDRLFTPEEVFHIAEEFGAYWHYDYEAAERGLVGLHAELKSKRCSNEFFVSKILLANDNIRKIFAAQLKMVMIRDGIPIPNYILAIPDGATGLGKDLADLLKVKFALIKKINGRISLESVLGPGETGLPIEDFVTRGTGSGEAIIDIKKKQPQLIILPYILAIIMRGGVKEVKVEGVGTFVVSPVIERRVNDWDPSDCPLHKMGSKSIKPKATEENWLAITTSQTDTGLEWLKPTEAV